MGSTGIIKLIKSNFFIVGIVLVIFSVASYFIYRNATCTVTLELGMFAESNWDVANGNCYEIIDDAISRFESKHKNVKVHYYSGIRKRDYNEWLCQQLVSGKAPDVFMISEEQIDFLVSLGVLKKLDSLIEKNGDIKSWEYFNTAWNGGVFDDALYALPYETNFMLMAVNKTLLEKNGLEMPDNNWTWNDFYRLCKQVTLDEDNDGIVDTVGVCNYTWKEAVYSNGAHLFNDNGRVSYFSDQKVVEAVRFIQRLSNLNKGRVFTQNDFDNGKVAFMPISFAKYKTYISYPYKITKDINYDWQCVTMPAGNSGNNISEVNTLMMGINAHTKHEKLAYMLLEELTHGKEVQMNVAMSMQGTSALRLIANSEYTRNLLEDNSEKNKYVYMGLPAEILNKGYLPHKFSGYSQYMAIASDSINRIISDKKDADNSLQLLQRNINDLMEH